MCMSRLYEPCVQVTIRMSNLVAWVGKLDPEKRRQNMIQGSRA